MIDILIEIKNLKKSYGKQCVLDIASLTLPAHAVTAIVGPNGAGKSTLLNILADLLPKDEGEILYEESPMPPLKEMTMVFQQPYLMGTTVEKNIAYPLKLRKVPQEEQEKRIENLSEELNLSHLLKKRAAALSLGEVQKVALARALSFEPRLLFLDEPCASIDPHATQEIERLLLKIKKEKQTTILLVTHNLAQAKRIADYVVLLHEGRVIESAEAEAFFTEPAHPLTKKFIEGELLL